MDVTGGDAEASEGTGTNQRLRGFMREAGIDLQARRHLRALAMSKRMMRAAIVALVLVNCGCARKPQMRVVENPGGLRPRPGSALVLFVRPGRYFGKAIGASLWDDDRFLGLLTNATTIAHQASPGEHRFGLLSGQPAAPAFLDATLQADRIYYVQVVPRSAWTRPPFCLTPSAPSAVEVLFKRTKLLAMDEQAYSWEREHGADARAKLRRPAVDGAQMSMSADMGRVPADEAASTFSSTEWGSPQSPRSGENARNVADRLEQLKSLYDRGLISQPEFTERRQKILDDL